MANGYIGKISAIVTANTSDLSRKLSGAVGDVDKFANKLNASITRSANAAGASFDKIFTPLQKLERQFAAGLEFNLRTEKQVLQLRQLVSASEQVAKPLERAAQQTTKLSAAVAGEFQPALVQAQRQVKLLETAIDTFGSVSERSFTGVQRRVEVTAAAIRRLAESNSLVSGLASGAELRFQQPAFVAQASRAAELQRQAASLSPEAIQGGGVAALVGRQRQAAEEAETLLATLERIRVTRSGDAAAAEAAYNSQIAALRGINDQLEREITLSRQASRELAVATQPRESRGLGLFGSQAGTDEERAIARARELSAEYRRLPASAQEGLQGLAGIAARVSDAVSAGTANAQQLNQVLDRLSAGVSASGGQAGIQSFARDIASNFLNILTPAEAAADTLESRQQQLGRRIGNGFLTIITPAEAAADTIEARQQQLGRRIGNGFLGIITPAEAAADTIEARQQELGRKIGGGFLTIITPQEAAADTVEARQQELGRRIGNGFLTIITPAEAAADTIEARQQQLGRRIGNGFLTIITPAEAAADTVEARQQELGRRIGNGFLTVITIAEAAADTVEARQQELGRRIGNGFLTIITPAEAAADTLEARQQELGRRIGDGFLTILTPAEAAADTLEARQQELGRRIADWFLNILTEAEAARDTPNAARAAAASRLLVVNQQESDLLSSQGQAFPLTGNRNPRQRVLDDLGGEIDVLRRRVGGLAEPLRETVGPAVDALTTRFQNLARAGVGFTAEEARRLSREVANVNAALASRRDIGNTFRESFGGAGAAGLGLGTDERSLRAIGSQIEFVQGRLAGLAQEARGPVLAALDALRVRAAALFDGGALDTERGRREIRLLTEELVRLLSVAGDGSERAVRNRLNRAGDVARGGADRASLALQQAAFAIEDFFSVTGGLDQRIRAAGNNISQLGFITGSTTGLIVGISAAIGGQLVAALIKWYNAGVGSEEQVKALNDALSRQKSLVEELAQAFRSLGDSIASRAFSGPAQEARAFARELEDIANKQQQIREGRVANLDPAVQRERGIQAARQRALEATVDPGERVALARQIEESRQREREAARAAAARTVSAEDIQQGVVDSIRRLGAARASDAAAAAASGGSGAAGQAAVQREQERTRREEADFLGRGLDLAVLRRELETRIAELSRPGVASNGFFASREQRTSAAELDRLNALLESLRLPENVRADEAIRTIFESANEASSAIEQAQKDVADAIQAGVPGLRLFQAELNRLAKVVDAAAADLEAAQREDPSTDAGRIERDRRIADAERRVNEARARQSDVIRQADAARFTRTVDPQSTMNNRMARATQNLSDAGVESGQIARRLREVEFQRETLRQMADARPNDPLTQRLVQQSEDALGRQAQELLAASAALRRFTEALNAAAQEAAANLSSAQQEADAARRAQLGFDTPRNRARREQADRDLEEQRQANARVEDAVAIERDRLERQALGGRGPLAGVFAELEAIQEEIDSGNYTAERYAELIAERRRLEEQVTAEAAKGNAVIAARDDSTRIAERQGSARRGEELSLTPAERAAEQMAQGMADINAYFDQMAQNIIDAENGLPDQAAMGELQQNEARRREAQKRFEEDQMRAAAPMLFDMMDQVTTAVLQGPSRAALGATDASTTQGQAELNRLIRGDDAARDVNLAELQRQTQLLKRIADKPGAPVA